MYLFNAFYVTYGDNYKRYSSVTVFDLLAYSTGVSVTTFGNFSHVFELSNGTLTFQWPLKPCVITLFYTHLQIIIIDKYPDCWPIPSTFNRMYVCGRMHTI